MSMPPSIPPFLRIQPEGLLLSVKVQPRASANEIGAPLGAELCVKVNAAPVDAAANEAVLRLLAATFDCPRGSVELLRGHKSRHKVIKLHGLAVEMVLRKLSATKR